MVQVEAAAKINRLIHWFWESAQGIAIELCSEIPSINLVVSFASPSQEPRRAAR